MKEDMTKANAKDADTPREGMARMVVAAIIALLFAAMPVHAAARPNVVVSGFSLEDAFPGKDVTLALTLENAEASSCAKDVIVGIQASSPFIMRGVSSITAGDLCSKERATVEVPLRIDASAVGGFYQVIVISSYESVTLEQFSTTSVLNVEVKGTPVLQAYVSGSDPVDVYPGDSATVMVNLENAGSYQAQSVQATMTAQSPVEMKWSKSFNSIVVLPAKTSRTLEFAIEVPKDAHSGEYDLILAVSYEDEDLNTQKESFTLPFSVKKRARFETQDIGSDSLYSNENGKAVRINLKNVGTDAARKMSLKVLPQFPFSTDGSSRFIQLLEVGKDTPLDFTVDVDKDGKSGTYALDILVDWEDATGRKFQDTTQVSLTILKKSLVKAVFLDYWFVWAAVVIVILLVIRKKTGKKK